MTTKQIIDSWLDSIQIDLVKNYNRLGLRATGNWARELEQFKKLSPKGFNIGILGEAYTGALEDGRKPTSGNAGSPTLREIIRQWIDDKPIIPKGDISKDSLAFLIARKIHEDGIRVPNKYNARGLVSDVITKEAIEDLNRQLSLFYIDGFSSDVLTTLK